LYFQFLKVVINSKNKNFMTSLSSYSIKRNASSSQNGGSLKECVIFDLFFVDLFLMMTFMEN